MGDLEHIFCCKCLNILPDHVIFPCGHFVCRKCEDITSCLMCGQPVCLVKDSFSLQCYRKMVSEGLLNPRTILPTKVVSNKRKSAKSHGVRKVGSKSQKQKKPRKNSTSANDETALTPRGIRSSARHSCKKIQQDIGSGPEESNVSSKDNITSEVIESDKPGIPRVNSTKQDDALPHVHRKKARLLKNCLSASKPRLSTVKNAGPNLDDIVKTGSPPLKRRKNDIASRDVVTRLSLKTAKRHIDSSDEDDGVFIDSDPIVGTRKTVEVVAQVHAGPCFSSEDNAKDYVQIHLVRMNKNCEEDEPGASSLITPVKSQKEANTIKCLQACSVKIPDKYQNKAGFDNSQTNENAVGYTQIGLGHLDEDDGEDDPGVSSLITPVKSRMEANTIKSPQAAWSSSKQNLFMSSCGSSTSGEFAGFPYYGNNENEHICVELKDGTSIDGANRCDSMHKDDEPPHNLPSVITSDKIPLSNSVEMKVIEHPGDESIIKSSVPPVEESPNVKSRIKKSRSKLRVAEVLNQDHDAKNVNHKTGSQDVARSDNNAGGNVLTVESPLAQNSRESNEKDIYDDSTRTVKGVSAAEDEQIIPEDVISESLYFKDTVNMDIEMELGASCCAEDVLLEPNVRLSDDNVIDRTTITSNDSTGFIVETPKRSHSEVEDFFTFVENCSSKYLENREQVSATIFSPESPFPQNDVGRPDDPLQEIGKGLSGHSPSMSCNITVEPLKHPYLLTACEVPDCFSFAGEIPSNCHEDSDKLDAITNSSTHKLPTTANVCSSEPICPPPDKGSSYDIPLLENEKDLPADSPRDEPPSFAVQTPKRPYVLFKEDVPDSFSFAGEISSNNREDSDKLQAVTNVSSSELLNQPKVSAIITPPSSTSGKTQAEIQPTSESNSRVPCLRGSLADFSHDVPSCLSSQTSLMDLSETRWHSTHQFLSNVFSKICQHERPKSLVRLAFDVLLLPLKNEEVFHGLSVVSPVTASAEKSVQVDLFLDQTTVKLELGKDLAKRNSFTRRHLSFAIDDTSPSKKCELSEERLELEESEDIVEGTPTKAQLVRVNLLNDSTCSPLSRTLSHEDSPAQIHSQSITNEVPAFSIFDPPTSTPAYDDRPSSPMKSSYSKTSRSPTKQFSSKDAENTPQMDNFNRSKPLSSTPMPQPMDTSLAYTDSESIIGDSEHLPPKKKNHIALPLGGDPSPKVDIIERINSPRPFRNITNAFQVTTTGIYDIVEKNAIRKLCGLIKATFSSELTKDTTHLILPDGDDVMVTTKFLMALYNGSYVLPMRWVFDCLISKSILPEADYLFKHPGIDRRMMMPRRPALFDNYAFYISPEVRKDEVNYQALKDLMKFCNCNITETVEGICRVASIFKAVVLRGADYLPSSNIKGRNGVFQVNYQWFYSCLTSYEIQPFDKHNYS